MAGGCKSTYKFPLSPRPRLIPSLQQPVPSPNPLPIAAIDAENPQVPPVRDLIEEYNRCLDNIEESMAALANGISESAFTNAIGQITTQNAANARGIVAAIDQLRPVTIPPMPPAGVENFHQDNGSSES